MSRRRLDVRELEREIQRVAERARVDAQEVADRLRGEVDAVTQRMRADTRAVTAKVRDEAQLAGARVKDEAPRKAVHLASIAFPLAILYLPLVAVRRTLVVVAIALLVFDLAKIHQPRVRTYFSEFLGRLIRRHERRDVTGSTYLVISALLATYLFEPAVAAAALVFLVIGDTLAAVVGKAFGRTRLFGKTLEGSLAGLASSFLAAWALVPGIPLPALAAGALAAAIVELLPIPVDDNFRIPLVAGLVLEWLR